MTKAMRMMEEQLALVDGVIAVLDARAPAATYNKNLARLFGKKPVVTAGKYTCNGVKNGQCIFTIS